jgi:hypothetical protein
VRRLLLVPGFLFLAIQICSATTCTSGTLTDYLGLGSGGCTIGANTLSNFAILPGQDLATELGSGTVSITPGGGNFSPSLTFSTSQTASSGALLESIFTFDISGPSYTSSALSLSGASETVDGAVTNIENFCTGGSFGPDGVDGCTGTAGSLLTLDGVQNTDQSPLGPASFLNVTNDFTLDGGTSGSASGGTFTDTFTATPEPASLLLALFGSALVAGASIRRSRQFQSFERTK